MSRTQEPPPTVGIDDAFGRGFVAARRELADLVDTPTWSLDDPGFDGEPPRHGTGVQVAGPAALPALAPSLRS